MKNKKQKINIKLGVKIDTPLGSEHLIRPFAFSDEVKTS